MSSRMNEYVALATKIKAMYGRRLHYEDFAHMAAMSDVSDVLDYLRQTAWAPAIARLDTLPRNRASLEAVLREQTKQEYLRLTSFVPRDDRLLISYPVRLAELEGIMTSLRRLQAGRILDPHPLPDRFLLQSRVDYPRLRACTSYDGLIDAAERSIYAGALRHLRPEQPGELPDYQVAESLLRTVYFTSIFRSVKRHYEGEVRTTLLRTLGTQVDLLNIIHVLRLKRYFPELVSTLPYLFPFHYRMKPAQLAELAAAPTLDGAFALLKDTSYAQAFENIQVAEVEDYYRRAMYRFHRRQLITGSPSVCTAIAYLHVKDAEVSALINLIESVNYGAAFDDSFVRLIGA